ncbi:MAG TPA: hypothetical protein VKZ59_10825, partial [Acidobacteriota bacterium]|nr:hypothetical protein [Acidobacteriota bacterium]
AAAIATDILPMLEAEAKERQREHGGTAPGRPKETLTEKFPEVNQSESREQAARLPNCYLLKFPIG